MKQQLSFFDQSIRCPNHSSPQSLPPRGLCRKQEIRIRKGRGWVSEEENGVGEKIGAESRGGDSARNNGVPEKSKAQRFPRRRLCEE
jgi:hypothetical protein